MKRLLRARLKNSHLAAKENNTSTESKYLYPRVKQASPQTADTSKQPFPASHWLAVARCPVRHDFPGAMPYSAAAGHATDSSALSIQGKVSKSKLKLYLKLHEIIILLMDFAEMSLGRDIHSPPTHSYFLQVCLEMPVI